MFQSAPGSRPIETPSDGVFDVAVVGAGAAGIGAARRLAQGGAALIVLEAKDRPGGRAHTLTGRSGAAIDLGCGWLHSADCNPWTALAEEHGYKIDRSRPAWERRLTGVNGSAADAQAFADALERFEARLAAAAAEPDRPAAELFDAELEPYRDMLDAFSGAYNGVGFRDISVHDYAAYQPTDENWRLPRGYGALVAEVAAALPVAYDAPVHRIDRSGPVLRLLGPAGEVQARRAVVTVPTAVLAGGRLAFDPPLPEVAAAADALPLGHVDKCFLRLETPDALPVEVMVTGRTDTADTGSYTLRPFGRAMIEGFFGGDVARALEGEGARPECAGGAPRTGGGGGAGRRWGCSARTCGTGSGRWRKAAGPPAPTSAAPTPTPARAKPTPAPSCATRWRTASSSRARPALPTPSPPLTAPMRRGWRRRRRC